MAIENLTIKTHTRAHAPFHWSFNFWKQNTVIGSQIGRREWMLENYNTFWIKKLTIDGKFMRQ